MNVWKKKIKVLSVQLCLTPRNPRGLPDGSESKESVHNTGYPSSILGSRRSPGEGNDYPLQYSCLENSTDRGDWWATVHGVTKSRTRLSDSILPLSTTTAIHHPDQAWFRVEGTIHGCGIRGVRDKHTRADWLPHSRTPPERLRMRSVSWSGMSFSISLLLNPLCSSGQSQGLLPCEVFLGLPPAELILLGCPLHWHQPEHGSWHAAIVSPRSFFCLRR